MNRFALHLFVFFLSFSVEVRVHAKVLEQPKQCVSKGVRPCTVFVQSERWMTANKNWTLRVQTAGAITLLDDHRVRLVTGKLDAEAQSKLLVETLYGDVALDGGHVLMDLNSEKVMIYGISQNAQFRPRGANQFTALMAGFQQFMGRVDQTGHAASGYGAPAVSADLVELWSGFYSRKEISEFKDRLVDFRAKWKHAVDAAGPWYVETANRQIASLESEREKQRRRREAIRKDREFYKEMFRRRNYVD